MPTWTVSDHLEIELDDVYDARIRIVGGEVSVKAGEGKARLEVTILSGSPVEVVHELETLRVFHPEWTPGGWRRLVEDWQSGNRPEAVVTLVVPVGTQLELTTVSAAVVVTEVGGPLTVNTVSGEVTLKDVPGFDVKTVSGDVDALGAAGEVKVKTVSGSVTVVGGACTKLDAKSVSGDVTLNVDVPADGAFDISTVSGMVGLLLPSDPSLVVEATSLSGRLVTDYGLEWEGRGLGKRRVRERIGEGAGHVALKTLSGDIRLARRKEVAA